MTSIIDAMATTLAQSSAALSSDYEVHAVLRGAGYDETEIAGCWREAALLAGSVREVEKVCTGIPRRDPLPRNGFSLSTGPISS